jgi:hypothetical protein
MDGNTRSASNARGRSNWTRLASEPAKRVFVAVALPLLLAGCHSAHVAHPLDAKLYDNDADTQLEFWHSLATQKLATNDEAFHGILLYLDQKDDAKSYEQRVATLKGRKMLSPSFKGGPNDAVTRGTLSVPIARALQIKGGLMMHLTGPNPRYATRELEYMGLYPSSSPNQIFSGSEFVGIVGKLDDYQNGVPPPVTGRLAGQ